MKWISVLVVSACLLTSLQAGPDASTAIPADSSNPFDFRGKPQSDYPPYAAVFQAKTYGELRERLENFFEAWEKDKKTFSSVAFINAYFHCKSALVRTCYLVGDTTAGDEHLMKLDLARPIVREILQRDVDAASVHRLARQIQTIHGHLGLKDPFPRGLPKDEADLYLPLTEISQATFALRAKEPEEELEDGPGE